MHKAQVIKSFKVLFYLILFILVFQMVGCGRNEDNQIDEKFEIPEVKAELDASNNKTVSVFDKDGFAKVRKSVGFGLPTPQNHDKTGSFNLIQYVKEESYVLSSSFDILNQESAVVEVDVEAGYNLYIYSGIIGAVEAINIYTPDGKLYDTVKHIACDNPMIIENAEDGKWSIEYIPIGGDLHQAEIETIFAVKLINPLEDKDIFVNSLEDEKIAMLFNESQNEQGVIFRVREAINGGTEGNAVINKTSIKTGRNYYFVSVKNEICYSDEVLVAISYDSDTPIITIRGLENGSNVIETHEKYFGFGGIVSELADVRINGEEVLLDTFDKDIYFGYNAELTKGDNEFIITATDKEGNKTVKNIIIRYIKD